MDIVIQITMGTSEKTWFIHLNDLVQAINDDIDLNPIPVEDGVKALQSLFVLSEYFFVGFGKVAFYTHSSFISGESGALNKRR